MPEENKSLRLLRLVIFLIGSYSRTKKECTDFLGIRDSSFYSYCNDIKCLGFDLHQKEGKYWIEANEGRTRFLANLLHFSEEEAYILSRTIDTLDESNQHALKLKQKLVAFLNQDKALEAYLKKDKPELVQILNKSIRNRHQVLLRNYASGNSQTVRDRYVEAFEFKNDFNLVWAYDLERKMNLQFKICRMETVEDTGIKWEYAHLHESNPVDVFRNTGKLDKLVELELNLRAFNLMIEEYPLSEKHITPDGNNRFVFKAPVARYEGPGRFVLGIADDTIPKGDQAFIAYLREKVKKYEKFF